MSNTKRPIMSDDIPNLGRYLAADASAVFAALDTLALALTEHGHAWTAQERAVYERAVKICTLPVEAA